MTLTEETGLDVDVWLDENWDPDLTVAEWWSRLADAVLAHPMLPAPWGRDWSQTESSQLVRAMVERKALGPPSWFGMMLAAPTIIAHVADELQHRLLPSILNVQHGWCQLFSEPGAGSDLAGLQCRAERDGDEWVVNGQKVWTSGGQWADYGILVARTDPDQPKHRGLTYFAFPMPQPGLEVRPLRAMTGRARVKLGSASCRERGCST